VKGPGEEVLDDWEGLPSDLMAFGWDVVLIAVGLWSIVWLCMLYCDILSLWNSGRVWIAAKVTIIDQNLS